MADDVMRRKSDAQPPAVPARPESRSERARRTVYRRRFALLYVFLAVVAGAALGATLVLIGRGSPAPAPPWSDWRPTGSAERREAQIADHVSTRYRLPSGNQLATAVAGPPTATLKDGTTIPLRAILVRPDTSRGQAEPSDIGVIDARGTLAYVLCGLGNACSIAEGAPSAARLALLRREALELALYTFKYVDGVQSVLVLLPPRPDLKAADAVFLERSDVRSELRRPLAQTLASPLGIVVGDIVPRELATIDRITRPRLYTYYETSSPDGSPIMVLAPVLAA